MKKAFTILAAGLCLAAMLTGCGSTTDEPAPSAETQPQAEQTEPEQVVPQKSTTPIGKPDAIPFTDDQLYAVAWIGYDDISNLSSYLDTYLGVSDVPAHVVSKGDCYLIIPRYEGMEVKVFQNDLSSETPTLVYQEDSCQPFLLQCNVSDIFNDVTVRLTYGDEIYEFSPALSLEDGSVIIGEKGLNLTKE